MITYLLPILIAYNGGRMVHGVRGGVVGATVTMGIIVGTDVPQFLGAMIMGPLGGWLIKLIDDALEDKMPVGFEMLINNFTAGILAGILALLGYKFMSPVLTAISNGAEAVVDALINARLLPLAALIVEPAKVLFLNNALNHGVLAPLGVAAVEETGKAIHFLLETNPGPGLGLLVAYYVAGKGLLKESAPSAMIVHFLGGIHEIYFPFVLAHPIMIVAVIAGGFAADLWFTIFNAGVVATPSPGSIFAYLAVIPRGQHFPVLMGVLIGAVASFLVGALLLKSVVKEKDVEDEEDVEMDASAPIPGLG
jgi:PTS system mannitol-specific IIC component